ncbi:hypothetical protein QTJ16_000985 [Diplocarpon rosae]|uniref:Uncharacterized protein n=1 Tax=Diplocarpon rosae TaxID=946125 RepID=A0AAD9WG45_9HELO|nr:hypothetical protein QTJ16_000985 [Diplocarpon rosae]PBP26501.1 hypothetical protein BUE80_DR002473 [Diplocarpon rosae]
MSTIPSSTQSLRKPAAGSHSERTNPAHEATQPARQLQSPSRLPVKPPTRTARSTSTSTGRPPSATGGTSHNASMRPPPLRTNIITPTTTGSLQRSISNRRANPPAAATTEPEPVKKDRSRPPIVTSRHLRNASTNSFSSSSTINPQGHARTRSSTLVSSSTALPPSKRNSVEITKPQPATKRSSVDIPKLQPANTDGQLKRQAFSTYQQHFSPAKNLAPKPHPAAFLAPPSPSKLPSNVAISAEIAKLQNELLQLHLLHRDAAQVEREWKASAKMKLGVRFQHIVDKREELLQLETEENAKINAVALKSWQELGTPGWGLAEKIQVLDEVITGVWSMGEPGGKYSRVVRKFDRWLRRCQDILEARAHDDGLDGDEVVFLEELDRVWKDDCLAIGRKLEAWRDHLRELGTPEGGSSLKSVVCGSQGLVRGMLAELNIMAQIEQDAMRMEVEWIKSMNDEDEDDSKYTHVAGAIWRSH